MSDPAFFGYGSLVNLSTHDYANPRPAILQGWRRVWQRTNLRDAAFLSVIRDEITALKGVVAQVPNADWDALDTREAAYARHDVSANILDTGSRGPTAVYQVSDMHLVQEQDHPILLSYLDVVVQGYLRMFGIEGVAHFFDTTDGWGANILDDRSAPIYSRHQVLSAEERRIVDRHLSTVM